MTKYEEHIDRLEASTDLPTETVEAAQEAMSFVAALHNLYVSEGVLNEDAPIDCSVLENLTDAYHGELAAAAIFLSEDGFKAVPEFLRKTAKTMDDPSNVVPLIIKRGFERLANRIERARQLKAQAFEYLKNEREKQRLVDIGEDVSGNSD